MDLLNHPAVQGGVAPLLVALVIAAALARTRFAWLAITDFGMRTGVPNVGDEITLTIAFEGNKD